MMKIPFIAIGLICLVSGCDDPPEGIRPDQVAYLHIRPAWSPNGQTIAFCWNAPGQFGIWLVDTNGANLRLLHSGDAVGPAWSPDGNWVSFSQGNQIFARAVATDSLRLLVSVAPSIQPAWSPDGNKILFLRQQSAGRRLVVKNLLNQTETLLPHFGGSAAWMPSGTQVFFVYEQITNNAEPYRYILQRATLDSSALNTITVFNSAFPSFWFRYDSTNANVVYEYAPSLKRSDIRVIDFGGSITRTIVSNGGSDPAISPDGSVVAYTATSPVEGGIWLVNIDGTNNRRLTLP